MLRLFPLAAGPPSIYGSACMNNGSGISREPHEEPRGEGPLIPWWGDYALAVDEAGRFRIGPFELIVSHTAFEWRVAWLRGPGEHPTEGSIECPRPSAEIELPEPVERLVASSRSTSMELRPVLADRPVVARPEIVFRLLPNAEIRLYVSTPVWVQAKIDDPPRQVLDETTLRLSDTWFGAPTAGELCYAIKIKARLHLENLPLFTHRATTVVVLKNRSETVLLLERLKLPAPNLSLYADDSSRLWTQMVYVESDREGHMAQVDIGRGPPEEATNAELVSGARAPSHQNLLIRALGTLLT